MANSIKESSGGLALQVTLPARDAGLVEEDADGNATRLAGVYVYGVEGVLLVIDADRVTTTDRAELVTSAARDTESVYQGVPASLERAGNGYQVQLPGAADAGFDIGDRAPCQAGPNMLLVHQTNRDAERLTQDLLTLRQDQIS